MQKNEHKKNREIKNINKIA